MSTLELDGDLTVQTAAEQCPRLLGALEKGGTFRIRLAGVTEFDTAGLQILLAARREAERLGATVEFRDAGDVIREALAVVNLDGTLQPIGE